MSIKEGFSSNRNAPPKKLKVEFNNGKLGIIFDATLVGIYASFPFPSSVNYSYLGRLNRIKKGVTAADEAYNMANPGGLAGSHLRGQAAITVAKATDEDAVNRAYVKADRTAGLHGSED